MTKIINLCILHEADFPPKPSKIVKVKDFGVDSMIDTDNIRHKGNIVVYSATMTEFRNWLGNRLVWTASAPTSSNWIRKII